RTVTVAMGHGKKAARHIDAWLRGTAYAAPPKHELASFENLNPWYYSDASKTVRPVLDLARRTSTFDEVVTGLDETNALFASRCCAIPCSTRVPLSPRQSVMLCTFADFCLRTCVLRTSRWRECSKI